MLLFVMGGDAESSNFSSSRDQTPLGARRATPGSEDRYSEVCGGGGANMGVERRGWGAADG